jgi:hypothetical protein
MKDKKSNIQSTESIAIAEFNKLVQADTSLSVEFKELIYELSESPGKIISILKKKIEELLDKTQKDNS